MIRAFLGMVLVCSALSLLILTGCDTATPGMTNTMGTYEAVVNGPPDKVTDAAVDAVNALNLTNVTHVSSKIDGTVTAKTARGDDVKIMIDVAGDNTSKVKIHVGGLIGGNESVSTDIYNKIKASLAAPVAPAEGGGMSK